ncbi:hypothetical protein [Hymenobacter jeollabukensis]|uniref:Uncharacterized protein n=1 Tax=Hymenobacter jeollabukensis TaxID=2025313 RepID=A0A5R8WSK2_9BACT|nr:hypothetical protein [Hymenobacter jeollabukensis]TLM94142.1 hypothetical protein FDY95_08980 [Hymenobacter jeollabukensis]
MNLEAVGQQYALNDGEIRAVELSLRYGEPTASKGSVQLRVRKQVAPNKYESCLLTLELSGVTKVLLDEDFTAGVYYSDIVLTKLENGLYYLSLDPFGNSGKPHEQDNLILVAQSLIIHEA